MKRKRDKSRVYRRNTFLDKKLEESRLRLEMYRKIWLRLKGKPETKGAIETPRSKTRRLLRDASSSYVKRTLDFHHVLIEQMLQNSNQNILKKSIKEILKGKIMKKYQLTTQKERDTCLCKTCENTVSLIESLKK